ncbi:MAG: hypothetical protein ACRC3B_22470 [Bacteroidia bacterium]
MKTAFSVFLLFIGTQLLADQPGAEPRPAGSFAVSNVSAFPEWRFYFGPEDTPLQQLRDSAVQVMPGGRGAPIRFTLYAQRISDSLRTKPLHYACYDGQLFLKIDSINLKDTMLVLSVQKTLLPPMQELKEEAETGNRWVMWISIGAAAAAVVTFLMIWMRRRKKIESQNHS